MDVENMSYIDILWEYTDHSLNYGTLVDDLRKYAGDGHADYASANAIADLIDENLKAKEKELPGAGPFLPALALLLLSLKGVPDEHRKVVKRLVDKA